MINQNLYIYKNRYGATVMRDVIRNVPSNTKELGIKYNTPHEVAGYSFTQRSW